MSHNCLVPAVPLYPFTRSLYPLSPSPIEKSLKSAVTSLKEYKGILSVGMRQRLHGRSMSKRDYMARVLCCML